MGRKKELKGKPTVVVEAKYKGVSPEGYTMDAVSFWEKRGTKRRLLKAYVIYGAGSQFRARQFASELFEKNMKTGKYDYIISGMMGKPIQR